MYEHLYTGSSKSVGLQYSFYKRRSLKERFFHSTLMIVKSLARYITILLLMVFCVTFVVELDISSCQECQTSTSQSDHEDCCDMGQCHFGHCSHMNFVSDSSDHMVPVLVTFYKIDSLHFWSYYTDQPTRPPQFS